MVFTFHHWDPNAWAELTLALRAAGFRLINRYVVFSENPISVHINNLNSIKHDAILVLALGEDAATGRWQPVEHIDTGDSETFCRQCAAALGWLLDGDESPADVRATWKMLIQREGSNGKKRK
jgi:adenine-specific DNA methylase